MRWYRAYIGVVPERSGGRAEQLPARRAAVRGQALRRSRRRVREGRLRLPGACEERRRRLRGAAELRGAGEARRSRPSCRRCSAAGVDSALRFAQGVPERRARRPGADQRGREAVSRCATPSAPPTVAQQVLALDPPARGRAAARRLDRDRAHRVRAAAPSPTPRRGYAEVIALTPEKDAGRNELVERLAASIYKQGEQARARRQAARRGGRTSPRRRGGAAVGGARHRAVRRGGRADRAEGLGRRRAHARRLPPALPEPPAAGRGRRQARGGLPREGQWAQAAGEFERLAATHKDPQVARDALWQAAELYEKGGARAAAAKAYERYLKQYPEPLEPSHRSALSPGPHRQGRRQRRARARADEGDLPGRPGRRRARAPTARATSARPRRWRWPSRRSTRTARSRWSSRWRKQLKLKKARMEEVLKAYAVAADYGVADVTTAATYHIAALYQDFGKALLASQRPEEAVEGRARAVQRDARRAGLSRSRRRRSSCTR